MGGWSFEVSHELVERHPTTKLAILAEELWDNNKAIFMDRNSEQFEYVLDYVHTGHVVLPINISRTALLQDLKFYGFESIPPNAVMACTDSASTLMKAMNLCDQYKQELQMLDMEIAQL